jgi:ABC-type transporter Mla MlaB component
LSKAITIIALTCFLVAGAAVTSILSRESMVAPAAEPAPVVKSPVANRESKQDRLSIMSLAQASIEQPRAPTEVLRQAYAASSAADIEAAKAVQALSKVPSLAPPQSQQQTDEPQMQTGALPPVTVPQPAKPRVAAKPAPQKSYSLLSDVQIAGIKDRLKLSSSQEYYWPSVETALRAVARKLNAAKLSNPQAGASQLDPDCEEVQQLKSAAMPLLFQLREDQKEEVRKLARIIGLEKVAAQI